MINLHRHKKWISGRAAAAKAQLFFDLLPISSDNVTMPNYVITGASRGIGLEYVRQLASDPNNTIVSTVRDPSAELKELRAVVAQSGDRVQLVDCDMASSASLDGLQAKLTTALSGKQINFLINNAAINEAGGQNGLNVPGESIMKHIEVNVVAPSRVLQSCLSMLAPGAVIANVSSGSGSQGIKASGRTAPGITSYSISKSALNMLTIHQAYQLRDRAIVIAIDPGHVKTDMGGPNAFIEIPDSARGVLSVLNGLQPEDGGKFLRFDGTSIDW